jgi:hypothetical protein
MGTSKPSFILQDRDLTLLRDLFESRAMTAAHISALHFEGKPEATKKRLQILRAGGLITARQRHAAQPAVILLARGGLKLLQERGILNEYPSLSLPALERRASVSDLTIQHELDVMDVKAAFHEVLRGHPKFKIAEFGTWPRLYEFEAEINGGSSMIVRPDGFIRIREKEDDGGMSEHTFFLEVDRSTEVQDILISRAAAYLDYYKSGGFAVKNGAPRSASKDYPFRVLMVFKSAERRNNIAERLYRHTPPILTQVYCSTIGDLRAGPLKDIWVRPMDYRDAVQGSPFDGEAQRGQSAYRRARSARENFVEAKIKRIELLTS